MSKLANKIEANDLKVQEMLDKKKYTVDYFQLEYSRGQKHTDLTSSFLNEYREGDSRDIPPFPEGHSIVKLQWEMVYG